MEHPTIAPRAYENFVSKFEPDFGQIGYEVLRGNRLKKLKLQLSAPDVHEMSFVNIKSPQNVITDIQAFLK